jgi:hypothetical protein
MPIYNNAALGQGFSNLAAMFAPPSAQELAGYASAKDSTAAAALKKQKLDQVAQFFNLAQNPNANHTVFDQTNAVVNGSPLSTGYYGVDQDNATSRANNANTVRGSTIGQLFGPLSQGQVRPEVPANVASTVGLPDIIAAAGAPKPLSETEARGAIVQDGRPGLTPQDVHALTMAPAGTQNVVGPSGQPEVAYDSDAVGKQPAYAPGSGGLTVTTNPDGTTTVTQGKSLTESQSKDAYYLNNGLSALPTLDEFGGALTNLPTAMVGGADIGGVNVGNYAKGADYQQAEQAGRVFINAILRKESGAAITPAEDASYGSTYLPKPGDKPENLAQKKLARERAMQGIQLGLPAATILQMEKAGIIPPSGATVDGQTPPAADQYTEGQSATNPTTGEKLVYRGGQWGPA